MIKMIHTHQAQAVVSRALANEDAQKRHLLQDVWGGSAGCVSKGGLRGEGLYGVCKGKKGKKSKK
jgi:hypothetical protein